MKQILLNVKQQKLFLPVNDYIVESSKNYLSLKFNFIDSDWSDCDLVIAVLENYDGKIFKEVLDNENCITVKKQVLTGGYFKVCLRGYNNKIGQTIPTNSVDIPVNYSIYVGQEDLEETTFDQIGNSFVKARLEDYSRFIFTRNNGKELVVQINDTTYFKGEFTSLEQLIEKYPTGEVGEYAYVNTTLEDGDYLIKYTWDADSNSWKEYSTDKYVTSSSFALFKNNLNAQLEEKQQKLIAGENIEIGDDGTISAIGGGVIEVEELPPAQIPDPTQSNITMIPNPDINQKVIYRVSSGEEPTPVPNSGYVEKVYFNTSLSIDETVVELEKLTYNSSEQTTMMQAYVLISCIIPELSPTSPTASIVVAKQNNIYTIMDYGYIFKTYISGGELIIENAVLFIQDGSIMVPPLSFSGWNPNFNGEIEINTEVLNVGLVEGFNNTLPSGEENNKITSLLSLTSTFDGGGSTKYYNFDGENWNQLLTDKDKVDVDLDSIKIDVDEEMSDTSTNPVQNKVVKEYIDNIAQKKLTAGEGITITEDGTISISYPLAEEEEY